MKARQGQKYGITLTLGGKFNGETPAKAAALAII